MTQQDRILNYLQKHKKGITSKDAYEQFGATRLSAVIFNLKKQGYDITMEYETSKNRFGEYVTFGRYKLNGR